MFWGLIKMMWCLVTLPLKLIKTMIKLMAVVLLPIMVMKTVKHWMHK